MNKCIFLDRDGVLNVERDDYTFLPEDFIIASGVPEAIKRKSIPSGGDCQDRQTYC